MEEEVWKDIKGYEGHYQISSLGRVRSIDHVIHRTDGTSAFYRGRILVLSGDPYLGVRLCVGPHYRSHRVHRLVAEAFVPNPNGLSDVDHIDCDKHNNRATNLRWCTRGDNIRFAWENGLVHKKPYSEWPEESRENSARAMRRAVIRSDGKRYESTTQAAKDLGVSRGAVSHVLCGLTQTCQGFSFQYA